MTYTSAVYWLHKCHCEILRCFTLLITNDALIMNHLLIQTDWHAEENSQISVQLHATTRLQVHNIHEGPRSLYFGVIH